MKKFFSLYPNISRYILAIILFASALILSGIIDRPFLKSYLPYNSSILLLLATWVLLKTDNKSLSHLGINYKKLYYLPIGFLIGAIAFFLVKYLRNLYTGESFSLSSNIDYTIILYGIYTILPTVAVEEFLFRGYLFKKTIEEKNIIVANLIFATIFMLIHVLDENIMGNFGMMIFMIITIPIGHLLFATAFIKSKSLIFPIGIHLGNNWATRHLISGNDDGQSILFVSNQATFETWASFIGLIVIWNGFFLLVTYVIHKWKFY